MTADAVWCQPLSSIPASADRYGLAGLYPSLRRFAAVVSSSDGDPDDLVQAAVERLLRRSIDVSDPGAYLRRTMVRLESNRRRGLGRFRQAVTRLWASTHHDHYPSDLSVLDLLAPLDRSIVFLIDVEGWPSKTVGAQLGLTDAAVRTRATRARAEMRRHLGYEEET